MAIWIVTVVLKLARLASNALLLLESQRLILALLKPATHTAIEKAEGNLFGHIRSNVTHLWVPIGKYKIHTLIATSSPHSDITLEHDSHTNHYRSSQDTVPRRSADVPIHAQRGGKIVPLQDLAIVMLHGHSMSAAFFYRNFDHFTDMGFKVYAPDLLGWARSSRPAFQGDQPEHTVQFFVDSFTLWVEELNLKAIFLIGHSLGAYIAYEYASRYPAKVKHLTLITPAAITNKVSVHRALYFSLTPQRMARRLGLFALLFFFGKYPRGLEPYTRHGIREYAWLLSAQHGDGSGDLAFSNMIQWVSPWEAHCRRPFMDIIRPLPMPVCLIGATRDALVRLEQVMQLFEALANAGTNCSLYSMDTTHCPHFEDADTFASIMSSEIYRCAPSSREICVK